MFGPVVQLELLLGRRRGRLDQLRRLYAGWLASQFGYFYARYLMEIWSRLTLSGGTAFDYAAADRFASGFLEVLLIQQFVLLVLLTPAFVAGAITDEKARGTLQELLTTDLTSGEIVVGKLLGRLAQVALLALAGLPFVCFVALFTDFDGLLLLGLAVYLVLVAFGLGAASLLASVWCRQTRTAVLTVYAVGAGLLLLSWGLAELVLLLGPAAPAWLGQLADAAETIQGLVDLRLFLDADALGRRLLVALFLWGGFGIVCLLLAVARLRPAFTRQLEAGRRRRNFIGGRDVRPLGDPEEPIRWKEREVEGIAPLPVFRRVPRWLAMLAIFALTVLAGAAHLAQGGVSLASAVTFSGMGNVFGPSSGMSSATQKGFFVQSYLVFLTATLLVSIRCSGAITGERERQTWEALLLTPLPVRDLVRGKLWGIIGAVRPYLIVYGATALWLSLAAGPWAFGTVLLCLLFCVPALWFLGAIGLYCSVRFGTSSWKSLLATLFWGYVGSTLLANCLGGVLGCLIGIPIVILVPGPLQGMVMMGCAAVTYVGACLYVAETMLTRAQNRVIGQERTPPWKAGENCGLFVEQYLGQYENRNA